MSTRCVVRLIDEKLNKQIDLYHHYDGYVEGVGFEIIDTFFDKENKKLALPNDICQIANNLIKSQIDDEFKITISNHCDIEYLYTIKVNTKGEVYMYAQNVNNWEDKIKVYDTYTQQRMLNMYLKDRELIEPINNEQIKYIHALYIKDLSWSETRYRNFLEITYGVTSCKYLNSLEADNLIKILESLK